MKFIQRDRYPSHTVVVIVKAAVFLSLGFCFYKHIQDSYNKFRTKKTVMTTENRGELEIEFPSIAICPGYDNEKISKILQSVERSPWPVMTYFNTQENLANDTELKDSDITDWWKNLTFSSSEILSLIELEKHEQKVCKVKNAHPGYYPDFPIEIKEISTTSGNCFVLNLEVSMGLEDELHVKLNLERVQLASVYVFKAGGEMGLYQNYWPVSPFFSDIHRGRSYDFYLSKEVTVRRQSLNENDKESCSGQDQDVFLKCIKDWTRTAYLNSSYSEVCALPQSKFLIGNETNIKMCTTKRDSKNMAIRLKRIYQHQTIAGVTGCQYTCNYTNYPVILNQDTSLYWGNITHLYFLYDTADVIFHSEYLLYDFNSIVSSIGGSLGLFLGFSCWQFFLELVSYVEVILNRKLS